MLRSAHLSNELEPTPTPSLIRRQAQPLKNDAIDLLCKEELGQSKLRLFRQRGDRGVPDAEENATRDRFLVILDLLFEVELVLVLEGACRSLGHARDEGEIEEQAPPPPDTAE